MKKVLYLTFAGFIDTLIALSSVAFFALGSAGQALTPVGGTAAGIAAGCYAGASAWYDAVGCATGAVIGAVGGAIVGTFGLPLGIALGYVLCICISASFGTLLVTLLTFNGMFYGRFVLFAYLGKGIPFLNIVLPAWTTLVILSFYKKSREEKKKKQKEIKKQEEKQEELGPQTSRIGGMREIGAVAAVLLLFFSALPFFTAPAAHAQQLGVVPDPVQYIVAPEVPGPNQTVHIEAQGIGTFLGNATLTWSKDGVADISGVGVRKYSFTTGAIGTYTTIHLVINSAAQGIITHDFTFIPSSINLLWEADTSVPIFYRGKPLYSAGSRITVFAFPVVVIKGIQIPTSQLSYQWIINGEPAPDASGLGRSTLSYDGSQLLASEDISVDAYYGASHLARGEVVIPAAPTKALFYERNALRGELLDQALPNSISLNAKEITVQAEPYYFSNSSMQNGALSYGWTLGGSEASGPDSAKGILTLRQTGSGVGEAQLGVEIQNTDASKFVQAASAAVHIIFGEQAGGILNFLGL